MSLRTPRVKGKLPGSPGSWARPSGRSYTGFSGIPLAFSLRAIGPIGSTEGSAHPRRNVQTGERRASMLSTVDISAIRLFVAAIERRDFEILQQSFTETV